MTTLYYSASTEGFYNSDIHETLPNDALEISQERYDEVFAGQANGLLIVPDKDGYPVNVEPPAPTREAIQLIRQQEYQRTADPLFFGWQRGENTEQEWLDAVQAVKDANPYPVKDTK